MSQSTVSKRYAVALFQLAKEKSILDQIEADLKAVEASLHENKGFLTLLKQPKISKEKKKAMVKEVFSGVSETVMNTLLLLLDRKREDIILDLVNQFFELANEERGIAEAKVYSVKPLTEDEEKALSDIFAKRINKASLRIQNIVDNSLIGGIKLRIGNRIYDGSVQGKLERIERQLISAKS